MRIEQYRKRIIIKLGVAFYNYMCDQTLESHRILMETLDQELTLGAILDRAEEIMKLPLCERDAGISRAIADLSTDPESDAIHGMALTQIIAEQVID